MNARQPTYGISPRILWTALPAASRTSVLSTSSTVISGSRQRLKIRHHWPVHTTSLLPELPLRFSSFCKSYSPARFSIFRKGPTATTRKATTSDFVILRGDWHSFKRSGNNGGEAPLSRVIDATGGFRYRMSIGDPPKTADDHFSSSFMTGFT